MLLISLVHKYRIKKPSINLIKIISLGLSDHNNKVSHNTSSCFTEIVKSNLNKHIINLKVIMFAINDTQMTGHTMKKL